MSMIQSDLLLGQEGGAGYTIARSLRFNSSDSAYLSRTPASAGNRKTFTLSLWIKRGSLDSLSPLLADIFLGAYTDDNNRTSFSSYANNVDQFGFFHRAGGITSALVYTLSVQRDFSAWYHFVASVDSTAAVAADRVKLYINGVNVTDTSGSTYPAQNTDFFINNTQQHTIGRNHSTLYANGYLADIHFIDGQALDPTSFTEVSATTGRLEPKQYAGSFGTNGFWLKFSDNSAATATTLGKDYSGNSNNWTPNNLSVTAGAGNDSLVDTPTSYGTDTGAGGEVRGNYATFNPLASAGTFTNGNLDLDVPLSSESSGLSTIGFPSSGKWYWETTVVTLGADSYIGISTGTSRTSLGSAYYTYRQAGGFSGIPAAGSTPSSGATYTNGDVIGIAYDADNATLAFYKNGSLQGTYTGIPANQYFALNYTYSTGTVGQRTINFGQRPFAYTAPSGFKALCDTNLPAPVIAKPSTVMDVKLYTGNGSTQTISGLGFSPDFVWLKNRSIAANHGLFDTIRGINRILCSNSTAIDNDSAITGLGGVSSFGSSSFDVEYQTGTVANNNGDAYVAWTWDAGSSTVTNTQGSITSSVRANPSAGFSIVSWNTNTNNPTVGHGLGVVPEFIITKSRTDTSAAGWAVYHKSTGAQFYLVLNSTNAADNVTNYWGTTAFSSTTFSVGVSGFFNNRADMIAYCFAPVAGYSSMGSYVGNGSADGPFVYTGFRPRWLLIKNTSIGGSSSNWILHDTQRTPYNASTSVLFPNLSNAEATDISYAVDVLSNGFKLRYNNDNWNGSGYTYIYAAFAESPFQYARAR